MLDRVQRWSKRAIFGFENVHQKGNFVAKKYSRENFSCQWIEGNFKKFNVEQIAARLYDDYTWIRYWHNRKERLTGKNFKNSSSEITKPNRKFTKSRPEVGCTTTGSNVELELTYGWFVGWFSSSEKTDEFSGLSDIELWLIELNSFFFP